MVHVSPSQYTILLNPQVELYVPDVSTQCLPKHSPWVPMTLRHSLLSVVAATWRQCPVQCVCVSGCHTDSFGSSRRSVTLFVQCDNARH